jgi:hypothetical protein
MSRIFLPIAALFAIVFSLQAQTADEIIAKYVKTIGCADKMKSVNTLRRTGKFIGGGGFEAVVVQENKRPNMVREEFQLMGMTGINAYDGKSGWKISPFGGKKDPEPLGEEDLKSILEDADFDGPIIDYKSKGNTVEYVGMEPVEGTDAIKLKVTFANGTVWYYYMDTDYYVPIKIDIQRMVRGGEREYEITLGDYKEVNGLYFPFYQETNVKGSQDKSKVAYDTIEANVPLDDNLFVQPAVPAAK